MTAAFRARVASVVAPLPGVTVDDPWGGGHDAWKVSGKIFASIGAMVPGVSVKCPDVETALMLIDAGVAVRAPYFNGRWVKLHETVDDAELRHRLLTSYRLVRAGLPASVRKALPEPPEC